MSGHAGGKVDSAKSEGGSGRIWANTRDGGLSDGCLPRELPSLLTLWAGGSIVNVGWVEGINRDLLDCTFESTIIWITIFQLFEFINS